MIRVDEFNFDLPEELIAQTPLARRDESRLLVVDKNDSGFADRVFGDLLLYLHPEDVLVLNDTRVIPARLKGVNVASGAAVEILLLRPRFENAWEVLVKPGKRARPGARLRLAAELDCTVLEICPSGSRLVEFEQRGDFQEILQRVGETPLPPYIHQKLEDPARYQTVYSEHSGSVAAPTAGLHFTEEFLGKIRALGVELVFLTLHVGLATFRPVRSEVVQDHLMHEEYYQLSPAAAGLINDRKSQGGRIVAVGTTTVRVLESLAEQGGSVRGGSGWTDIFIYPGYSFQAVDALLTNFHLPQSTLLMLVSALAGREKIKKAYAHAIAERYRFFSFGDAMLII